MDLEGWSLTDDPTEPGKWVFPAVAMEPGAFLVVFASGKDRRPVDGTPLHASFQLAADGEYLGLFAPGASVSEARTWPGATLETRPDGSTLVRVGYQTVPWIARRVAARLGEAEVIEPAEVREAVRALADAVLAERR